MVHGGSRNSSQLYSTHGEVLFVIIIIMSFFFCCWFSGIEGNSSISFVHHIHLHLMCPRRRTFVSNRPSLQSQGKRKARGDKDERRPTNKEEDRGNSSSGHHLFSIITFILTSMSNSVDYLSELSAIKSTNPSISSEQWQSRLRGCHEQISGIHIKFSILSLFLLSPFLFLQNYIFYFFILNWSSSPRNAKIITADNYFKPEKSPKEDF